MKKLMLWITAFAAMHGSALFAQNITGTWQGSLQGPQGPALRIVMKISLEDDKLKATTYSIDQPAPPIPVSAISRDGSTVKMTLAAIGGSYEGKLSGDGNTITGTWTQGGGPSPLNLTRATPETAWAIPEPPPPKIMAADAKPEFEVATIKPSKPGAPGKGIRVAANGMLTTLNYSLSDLIQFAYNLHPKQIEGGPSWYETDKYDITGKPDHEGIGNETQTRAMVQKLLTDRFKLTFHREKKDLSVYAITVLKTGPKLTKSVANPTSLPGLGLGRGVLNIRNGTIENFASLLQGNILEKPVVDQTGLTDRFDFSVKYTPDASQIPAGLPPAPAAAADVDAPPDLFTAVQQQLGLKLESAKAPVDVLVIDKVEKPSED